MIKFDVFHYQKDLLDAFIKNRFNVILKARQLGITTIVGAFIAWLCIFHKHQNILIVATKQDTAKTTLRIIKTVFKCLPKWMVPGVIKVDVDNKTSLELSNGSRIKAVTTSDDVGRSEAVSLLFIDEVAFIEKMQELWVGLWPGLSAGGRAILASTPNGTGNFFHKTWQQASDKVGKFNNKFGEYVNDDNPQEHYSDRLMWWVHPEHDQKWFEMETADKSARDIAQEYACAFNASGETFIDAATITRMQSECTSPIAMEHSDRSFWIWENAVPGAMYLITADISRGDAKDFSAFHVTRIDTAPEQVAEYKGKIKPEFLGALLVDVSRMYNNAIIAPENNSGWSGPTVMRIQELNHGQYLYYTKRSKPKFKDAYGRLVDPYYAEMNNDYLPGYCITPQNRDPMLAKLELYLRRGQIKIKSERLVQELTTFVVKESGKADALKGFNDDLIMSLAGNIWIIEESFLGIRKATYDAEAMASAITISTTKTSNLKGFSSDLNSYTRGQVVGYNNQANKIMTKDGTEYDLNWLLSKG